MSSEIPLQTSISPLVGHVALGSQLTRTGNARFPDRRIWKHASAILHESREDHPERTIRLLTAIRKRPLTATTLIFEFAIGKPGSLQVACHRKTKTEDWLCPD